MGISFNYEVSNLGGNALGIIAAFGPEFGLFAMFNNPIGDA